MPAPVGAIVSVTGDTVVVSDPTVGSTRPGHHADRVRPALRRRALVGDDADDGDLHGGTGRRRLPHHPPRRDAPARGDHGGRRPTPARCAGGVPARCSPPAAPASGWPSPRCAASPGGAGGSRARSSPSTWPPAGRAGTTDVPSTAVVQVAPDPATGADHPRLRPVRGARPRHRGAPGGAAAATGRLRARTTRGSPTACWCCATTQRAGAVLTGYDLGTLAPRWERLDRAREARWVNCAGRSVRPHAGRPLDPRPRQRPAVLAARRRAALARDPGQRRPARAARSRRPAHPRRQRGGARPRPRWSARCRRASATAGPARRRSSAGPPPTPMGWRSTACQRHDRRRGRAGHRPRIHPRHGRGHPGRRLPAPAGGPSR